MTDYSALIERIEKASGEDRELDGDLDRLRMWGPHSEWENAGGGYERHKATGDRRKFGLWSRVTPNCTGSLDAALAFAEAVNVPWRGALVNAMKRGDDDLARLPRAVLVQTLYHYLLRAQAKDTP